MKLPIIISNPHCGLRCPVELESYNLLTHSQIVCDGDEGALEIYRILKDQVQHYIEADIARAYVDLNRHRQDYSLDGVIKTHTCWMERIYRDPLDPSLVETVLQRYYDPYHDTLNSWSQCKELILGVDCHTMAEYSPAISSEPQTLRPWVCLSNQNGITCPASWLFMLQSLFDERLGSSNVSLNDPFKGGYITSCFSDQKPWIQIELSRADFLSLRDKAELILEVISLWVKEIRCY